MDRNLHPPGALVSSLDDHDIVFGRGKKTNNLRGNIAFRKLVATKANDYEICDSQRRNELAQEVIAQVHAMGGRFLHPVSAKNGRGEYVTAWEIVSDEKAAIKVKQAIRDSTESRRYKMRTSARSRKEENPLRHSPIGSGSSIPQTIRPPFPTQQSIGLPSPPRNQPQLLANEQQRTMAALALETNRLGLPSGRQNNLASGSLPFHHPIDPLQPNMYGSSLDAQIALHQQLRQVQQIQPSGLTATTPLDVRGLQLFPPGTSHSTVGSAWYPNISTTLPIAQQRMLRQQHRAVQSQQQHLDTWMQSLYPNQGTAAALPRPLVGTAPHATGLPSALPTTLQETVVRSEHSSRQQTQETIVGESESDVPREQTGSLNQTPQLNPLEGMPHRASASTTGNIAQHLGPRRGGLKRSRSSSEESGVKLEDDYRLNISSGTLEPTTVRRLLAQQYPSASLTIDRAPWLTSDLAAATNNSQILTPSQLTPIVPPSLTNLANNNLYEPSLQSIAVAAAARLPATDGKSSSSSSTGKLLSRTPFAKRPESDSSSLSSADDDKDSDEALQHP